MDIELHKQTEEYAQKQGMTVKELCGCCDFCGRQLQPEDVRDNKWIFKASGRLVCQCLDCQLAGKNIPLPVGYGVN